MKPIHLLAVVLFSVSSAYAGSAFELSNNPVTLDPIRVIDAVVGVYKETAKKTSPTESSSTMTQVCVFNSKVGVYDAREIPGNFWIKPVAGNPTCNVTVNGQALTVSTLGRVFYWGTKESSHSYTKMFAFSFHSIDAAQNSVQQNSGYSDASTHDLNLSNLSLFIDDRTAWPDFATLPIGQEFEKLHVAVEFNDVIQ